MTLLRGILQTTVAAAITFTSLGAHAADPLRAKTDKGEVQGKLSDDGTVRIFLGIPYAAPPVGKLRWAPPQPAEKWKGVLMTQSFGHRCMQPNIYQDMVFHDPGASEDCLSLNIWAPKAEAGAKLPVMVWIYGGGYTGGSTSERRQDGEAFAHKGVVLVSMNYRLNIFGFFAHPELAAESPAHAAGNYGLMDQAAALNWVKRNIAAFGGDPDNITLFGESAGSFSVSAQMASSMAKSTIAHAIGESGAAFSRTGLSFPSAEVAEQHGAAFAGSIGKNSIAELRAMPAEDLMKAAFAQTSKDSIRFSPDVDGLFLTEPVPQLFAEGKQAHIPLLAGWNRDEMTWQTLGFKQAPTAETFQAYAQSTYGTQADTFLKNYPGLTDSDAVRSATDLASDNFIAASTWEWVEAQVETGGKPVYRYEFDRAAPGDLYHPAGAAFHSDEIEYVFGNLTSRPGAGWSAADYKLSDLMQNYWINFAKTGDPNGAGLPQWPVYDKADDWQVMHLDVAPHAAPDTHRQRYFFLREAAKQGAAEHDSRD